MKQSIAEGMMELQELRRRLRSMESELKARADAATPLMPDDERKMVELQSRADRRLPAKAAGSHRRRSRWNIPGNIASG